jgi:hypothetical protein
VARTQPPVGRPPLDTAAARRLRAGAEGS